MAELSVSPSEVIVRRDVNTDFEVQPRITAQAIAEHKCTYCDENSWIYMEDIEQLRLSNHRRCPLLRLALACFEWVNPGLFELGYAAAVAVQVRNDGCIELEVKNDLGESLFHIIDYLKIVDCTGIAHTLGESTGQKILPGRTSSDSTFSTINWWLENCLSNHHVCAQPLPGTSRDSLAGIRFLEIRQKSVRLRELQQSARYACLSHCWGSGQEITKTVEENIQQHEEKGIMLDVLPKTFRDAVQICQKLGIGYVWIDSLCIIQNSPSDWAYQASRMADVYQNAFVTIAATASAKPTQGCFKETHRVYQGEILPGYEDLHVRLRTPDRRFWQDNDMRKDYPLLERGWTFQELSLSSRIVHFCADEVVWQCRHGVFRESSPGKDMAYFVRLYPRTYEQYDTELLLKQWHEVIQVYTERELTFQKDRLPAIAAIAKHMQNSRGSSRYLAGLWEDTLLQDLLWCAPNSMESYREFDPNAHRSVPTWSWAHACGWVYWPYRPDTDTQTLSNIVKVLAVKYAVHGPVLSGNITQAQIELQAPLIKLSEIRLIIMHSSTGETSMDFCQSEVDALYTTAIDVRNIAPTSTLFDFVASYHNWDHHGCDNELQLMHDDSSFVIPLGTIREFTSIIGGFQSALIVQKVDGENRFRRLGVTSFCFYGCNVIRFASESLRVHETDTSFYTVWYEQEMVKRLLSMEKHNITLI
ncbi:HET-domain-containing protein [Dothidotthia symphoricarpi CBS 119687]|uniref:HET-domain-containing protein n=1 Tax=Dothidotthia symphoricarpi CBS 119687 TaxID=1392245 RepID=A0A6A6ASQ0_9PLEO|nr:HET-domain-containing protein [Dothidotthia symphoricarpi CBS 119687]KAF2134979.1 HET-domain-containing protein [Dothidotthia symphoricarpi CBS 119687]